MDIRSFSITLLALSLFCLSGSIVYFSIQLIDVNKGIPDILEDIEKTSEKVETVVKEVEQVRKLIPFIVNEVMETRKQIPSIVKEVSEFRNKIPDILEKVEKVNQQIPTALNEIKAIRQQIPPIIEEIEKTRQIIPLVLAEIKKTREVLPAMLSKAERIVTDAKRIGKTTTEGAVTGVITGIVKTPFEIVGGLGEALFGGQRKNNEGVTEQDLELIKLATYQVLSSAQRGHTRNWSNPQSGNNGTVTLKEFAEADGRDCRILNYIVRIDKKERINKEVSFCLDEYAQWKPTEE
jgi:archaellum component FlaC/surface antigen